jgi:outer membrane protein TolC
MKIELRHALIFIYLLGQGLMVNAAMATSELPPEDIVARVIRATHPVISASNQIRVEEANQKGLEAGNYEWNIRLGRQQLKSLNAGNTDQRYKEWNAEIQRPIRLLEKAATDKKLGEKGVTIAQIAHGDSLHEASRTLLKSWFVWLREKISVEQWEVQSKTLETQTNTVQRRYKLGDATLLESTLMEAAQAQAEAQRVQANARLTAASTELQHRFPGLPLIRPSVLSAPQPIRGTEKDWVEKILANNHELGVAREETLRAHLTASRNAQDRIPDPTIGFNFAKEKGGEDRVAGVFVVIPLPGEGRRAQSDASLAMALVSNSREAQVLQKTTVEATILFKNAEAAFISWQAGQSAANNLKKASEMTSRAYQLGEGTLGDVLLSRRLSHEAQLAASLLQLDALELRYRLLLDSHQLWNID